MGGIGGRVRDIVILSVGELGIVVERRTFEAGLVRRRR